MPAQGILAIRQDHLLQRDAQRRIFVQFGHRQVVEIANQRITAVFQPLDHPGLAQGTEQMHQHVIAYRGLELLQLRDLQTAAGALCLGQATQQPQQAIQLEPRRQALLRRLVPEGRQRGGERRPQQHHHP